MPTCLNDMGLRPGDLVGLSIGALGRTTARFIGPAVFIGVELLGTGPRGARAIVPTYDDVAEAQLASTGFVNAENTFALLWFAGDVNTIIRLCPWREATLLRRMQAP